MKHHPHPAGGHYRLALLPLTAAVLLSVGWPVTPAQAQTPWRFIAVGDTRSADAATVVNRMIVGELANEIVRQDVRFVVLPGDLVYSGSLSAFQQWKDLMAQVYAAGIPVLPVMGNHDVADVAAWKQVFGPDIPDNGPAGEIDRTYSYAHENVLVLALDNYVTSGRVNQGWVNSVLAANTRPHVFAFGHLPAFKANHADCLDDYPAERDAFWNSLRAANAGAYFAGHDHFYDHARIDDGDGNPDNDAHQLIVGSGGAPFHTSYAYDGINWPWTPVNEFHEAQYGYTLVEIDGPQVTMTFYHRTGANTWAATSDSWTYTVGTAPVAVASANLTSGAEPLTVQFNGGGSYDLDGTIAGFAWDFGDGSTANSADPSHTYATRGLFTATLTVTDNSGLAGSSSLVITVTAPPTAASMHVGDLDGSRSANKKSWTAKVAVAVHDDAHKTVLGAVVTGRWTSGASASCRIGSKGNCSVSASSIPLGTTSVTFTVTGITKTGVVYDSTANHDVDGGTNGTTITVSK